MKSIMYNLRICNKFKKTNKKKTTKKIDKLDTLHPKIVVQCLVVVWHLLFVPIITFLCVDIYRNHCIIYNPIVLSLLRH